LTVPGAIDILTFAGKLAVVEEEEIQRIQNIGREGSALAEPWQRIRDGSRVRIIDGPLRGSEGRLVRRHREWVFVIEIPMLSRMVSVRVDGWQVERA
jgi:transcription antitermination factor NusG